MNTERLIITLYMGMTGVFILLNVLAFRLVRSQLKTIDMLLEALKRQQEAIERLVEALRR